MKRFLFILSFAWTFCTAFYFPLSACTGITLTSKDGAHILARTIEWGGSDLNSRYVIVPRGYTQYSFLPGEERSGMRFTSRYGYVGLAVEQKEFVAEGLNEAGLSAGLFYFPNYGEYEPYDEAGKDSTITDLQLVSWVLGSFQTVDEVMEGLKRVHVVGVDPRASTVHWRFSDASGRQVVLEIIGRQLRFYENELGVLTNSPDFEWQLTNLNNYVNLYPGAAASGHWGASQVSSFGVGSGFLGLPGDVTPPSRFVRAAFYQTTAPQQDSASEAVLQCFQILNNFDIPIGVEVSRGQKPADIPSATQWTSATDAVNRMLYYRTMYDSRIRCIRLKDIDFAHTSYQDYPLDVTRRQPVSYLQVH